MQKKEFKRHLKIRYDRIIKCLIFLLFFVFLLGKNYMLDLFVLHGEPPIAIPSNFRCFLKYSWILY